MIALFVLKLSAGITLMWLLMPRKAVTDGFFRIQMRLLLGTTVLATLLLTSTATWQDVPAAESTVGVDTSSVEKIEKSAAATAKTLRVLQIVAACIAYPGSIFWALGRRLPGNVCIYLLTLCCAGSVLVHSWNVPHLAPVWLQLGSDVSSSLVLGATLTGMLLGHWYLTTRTMSIQPLWWFNRMLIASAILRMTFSVIALAQFGFDGYDLTRWIWLILRLVGGCLIPGLVAFLVWQILKYRNTQSATGVLFAGLILVFMGEMTAALLERDVQIPY